MTPTIDFRFAPSTRWTCIGRPDDDFKTLVRQDGSLQYGWQRVISFGLQYAHEKPTVEQFTETPGSSITITRLDYGFAMLTLTAFGHQHDGDKRTDVVIWKLESRPAAPLLFGAITLLIDERDHDADNQRIAASFEVLRAAPPGDAKAANIEPRCLLRSVPQRLVRDHDFQHVARLSIATDAQPLEPGGTLSGAFLFPLNHDDICAKDLAWAEQALAAERAFWREYKVQVLELTVPDVAIQDMITACARNILQARVVKDGLPFFQVGPLVYRGMWVVDGHFITEAARYLGHDEAADRAWNALLKFRRDDGSIMTHPHHSKETGIALATFVRHSELSGDWERLKRTWPILCAAVESIRKLREQACKLDPSNPCYRLLPESYGDGGLGGKRPEYTTTLWVLAGLKQIAMGARAIGKTDDAARFQGMFEELRTDFLASTRRFTAKLPNGLPYLPMTMVPGQHNYGLTHTDNSGDERPWTLMGPVVGTWAFCQAIWPGEIFPPEHPSVQNLLAVLDQLDDEEGIPAETGWIPWRGLWNYYASFAAHVWLYAGRGDKAADYLYAFANHAAPTRVWREEQNLRSHPQQRSVGDMPHNWASAEFIRLVRNMLVFECGDTLDLLRGLPPEWIVPGRPVVVEQTPTRFGRVSLRLECDVRRNVRVQLTRDTRWKIQPASTSLWLPKGVGHVRIGDSQVAVGGWQVKLAPASVTEISFRFEEQ